MAWVNRALTTAQTFLGEVGGELRKSSWPSRAELVESSVVVIVSVLLLGAFIAASDMILIKLIRLLAGAG